MKSAHPTRKLLIISMSLVIINLNLLLAQTPAYDLEETKMFHISEVYSANPDSENVSRFIKHFLKREKEFNNDVFHIVTFSEHSGDKEESLSSYTFDRGELTDYARDSISGKKKIWILLIGKSATDFKIDIEEYPSSFMKSFNDLKNLSKSLSLPYKDIISVDSSQYSLLSIDRKKASSPCVIKIKVNSDCNNSKNIDLEVYESNWALFQVGITSAQIDVQQFRIANRQLTISADSENQEWSENLIAMLGIHYPRYQKTFAPSLFNWNKHNLDRLGLFVGADLSSDPLEHLYIGISCVISHDLSLNFGYLWANQYEPTITNIGDITNIDDARQFLNRNYSEPRFFWGISMTPSLISNVLNLDGD